MTQSWGPTDVIRTDRLILRPHTLDDVDDLLTFHSDPDVVRYVPWPVRDREMTLVALEEKILRGRPDDTQAWLVLAIELAETGRVIGEVLLKRDPDNHLLGELGYAIAREAWGQGYVPEAATAMLNFGFQTLEMHRICAICDVRNEGSWRVMEKLGMRREAHFLEDDWFKDEWTSTYVYALLSREWAQRPTRYRLSPTDFESSDSEQFLDIDVLPVSVASGTEAIARVVQPHHPALGERGALWEHPRGGMVLGHLEQFAETNIAEAGEGWATPIGEDRWDDLHLLIETPSATIRYHWRTTT